MKAKLSLLTALALCAGVVGCDGASDELPLPQAFEADRYYEHQIDVDLIAAGQPDELRVEEIVAADATIIDLRLVEEDPFDEPHLIEQLGGRFIRFPTGYEDLAYPYFRDALFDFYDETFVEPGRIYLHCKSSNRVGASWALYLYERRGVDAETALQAGLDAGLGSLEDVVRDALGLNGTGTGGGGGSDDFQDDC